MNLIGQNISSGTVVAWADLFTESAALLLQQEPEMLLLLQGTGQTGQAGTSRGKSTFYIRLNARLELLSICSRNCVQQQYAVPCA